MTRRRLTRARKRWNATRRVLRGWQAMHWDVLMDIAFAEYDSDLRNLQLRCIARAMEK